MPHENRRLSRREFLAMAGRAGAALGAGAGLGGVLSSCGGGTPSTTTTAGTTAATGPAATGATSTTVAPSSTTTVTEKPTTSTAGAEMGAEFKAGYVLPLTGSMADYGAMLTWQIDWFAKNIWRDGLIMGDKKKHKLTVVTKDSQSDLDRASQAAQQLAANEKVMLLGASAGADTVVPVREVAENFGCPCITFDSPGDAWDAGQPDGGYKWSWHSWFVLRDLALNLVAAWDGLSTNKVITGLYPTDSDGNTFADALPIVFQAKGYSYGDPGRFQDGAADYSGIIGQMRKQGAEILTGVATPSDFAAFWAQAVALGFRPEASAVAKALLLPSGVEALGDKGAGQTAECWFHPAFPYTGAVSGLTARQLCDAWEHDKGAQWVQPLCLLGQFEVWTDVLRRCTDPADKAAVVEAVKQTKTTTVGGPVDWTVNPDPYSGFYNFSTKPIAAGQWVKGAGAWRYDLEIVASATQPDIKTTAAVKALA